MIKTIHKKGKQKIIKGPTSYLAADDVVWRHADLAAVHELAPGQALDCVLQVAGLVHEGRGLAAQLQRNWRQVLVGRGSENTKASSVVRFPFFIFKAAALALPADQALYLQPGESGPVVCLEQLATNGLQSSQVSCIPISDFKKAIEDFSI